MKRLLFVAAAACSLVWHFGLYPKWESEVAETASIRSINKDLAAYNGKRVMVTGYVEGRISVLGVSAFTLSDGGQEVIDVAGLVKAPEPGNKTTVTGRLNLVKYFEGQNMPVIIVN